MPDDLTTLVVDLGATRTRIALVTGGLICERLASATAELVASQGAAVDALVAASRSIVSRGPNAIAAIGLGMAATVDRMGTILQGRDIGILAGTPLREAFADAFGVPVAVDNDANLAALAEHRLGAARGHATAAVLTLGTNIGLGLILDGRVQRGARGAAGEVGLLLVPAESTGMHRGERRVVDAGRFGRAPSAAPEGYAWIEELVGGGALAAAAMMAHGGSDGTPHARTLTLAALSDPGVRPLAQRAIEGWALIIADLNVVLDLEVVVLTGGVATDAAHLLDALQRRVAELVAFAPEIRLGTLGPDAELLGADLLARAALEAAAATNARAGLSAHATGGER
jgi:glucokinase